MMEPIAVDMDSAGFFATEVVSNGIFFTKIVQNSAAITGWQKRIQGLAAPATTRRTDSGPSPKWTKSASPSGKAPVSPSPPSKPNRSSSVRVRPQCSKRNCFTIARSHPLRARRWACSGPSRTVAARHPDAPT